MLNTDELQRLSEEVYNNRRLTSSVYCAECGYDLQTLPYQYCCPECGNEYNARSVKMTGVFVPDQNLLPVGDYMAAIFAMAIAALIGVPAVVRVAPAAPGPALPTDLVANYGPFFIDEWRVAMAGVLVVFAYLFLRRAIKQTLRYFHDAAIMRKIIKGEQDRYA
jgi:predicted nucleic-acid-binding Zn-ribbon protein